MTAILGIPVSENCLIAAPSNPCSIRNVANCEGFSAAPLKAVLKAVSDTPASRAAPRIDAHPLNSCKTFRQKPLTSHKNSDKVRRKRERRSI